MATWIKRRAMASHRRDPASCGVHHRGQQNSGGAHRHRLPGRVHGLLAARGQGPF